MWACVLAVCVLAVCVHIWACTLAVVCLPSYACVGVSAKKRRSRLTPSVSTDKAIALLQQFAYSGDAVIIIAQQALTAFFATTVNNYVITFCGLFGVVDSKDLINEVILSAYPFFGFIKPKRRINDNKVIGLHVPVAYSIRYNVRILSPQGKLRLGIQTADVHIVYYMIFVD